MRRIALVLLLIALAVRPAAAGSILFATAATEGRINGFCLEPRGGFAAPGTPAFSIALATPNPRRLLFVAEERPDREDAGTLYVAGRDRIEAFRIGRDGRVARRNCGTGESDRCRGRTETVGNIDAHGLAVSADKKTLYVVQRGLDRVVAYPLDDDGLPLIPAGVDEADPDRFTSCVQAPLGSAMTDVSYVSSASSVDGGLLFVSAEAGRVDVYDTNPADGRLCKCTDGTGTSAPCTSREVRCSPTGGTHVPTTPEECPRRITSGVVTPTTPFLQRRGLIGPTSIFVTGGVLYVQERLSRRLGGFRVDQLQPPPSRVCAGATNEGEPCTVATQKTDCPDSTCGPPPRVCIAGTNLGKPCTIANEAAECPGSTCGRHAPMRATRTGGVVRYIDMELAGSTLLGSRFFPGRIDSYLLQEPGASRCTLDACPEGERCCLPKRPTVLSGEDLRMSPVGLKAIADSELSGDPADDGFVLYVAGGDLDRVRAYRLFPNGLLRSSTHFSETDELAGSFPNDVAIAVLRDACR